MYESSSRIEPLIFNNLFHVKRNNEINNYDLCVHNKIVNLHTETETHMIFQQQI